jgi:WD40 repeat protein
MKIEMHRRLWFLLLCINLSLTSPRIEAAESTRLGDLRGVWQANFNQDATRLVVRTRRGEIGIWDTKKGTPIPGDPSLQKPSNTYVMSSDAQRILVGFKDGGAQVFDASSGSAISPVLDLSLREDGNAQIVFSPDGGTIVFLGKEKASLLDVKSGKEIATIPTPFELEEGSDSTALAIFADGGAKCFVMSPHGMVTAYETKGWTPVGKPMKHPAAEMAYDFGFDASRDGQWIVTFDDPGENGPKGQLQIWDALTGKPLGKPLSAVNGMSGRFLPGQTRVLVQSGRGEASVRDLPSMKVSYPIKQHDELDGPKVEVFSNGKWLLAWGPDKKIDLIDAATGKILNTCSSLTPVSEAMIPGNSASCYIRSEKIDIDRESLHARAPFEEVASADNHFDSVLRRFSVPDMKVTTSTRLPDFILRQSLSPDGLWLVALQGVTDKEKVVLFDATTLKPIEWPKP